MSKYQESFSRLLFDDYNMTPKRWENYQTLKELVDKEEKYRWHDLRKDPKDLPKCKQKVLVYRQIRENEYEYAIDYNCNDHDGTDCHYEVWESDLIGYTVLKWKYIEEDN